MIENHIELLKHLQDAGEADLLPTTIDSYTRQNQYENCAEGIRREKEGMANGNFHPYLNGFPAVNHGVHGCRQVVDALDTPLQVRHGTPDARLLTEIAYAAASPPTRAAVSPTIFRMQRTFRSSRPCLTGSMLTA